MLLVHEWDRRRHQGVPSTPLSFPRNCNRSFLAVKGSLRRETRAPLTAPGRSELLSAIEGKGGSGKAKSKSHLTETGILMEGVLTSMRRLFACPQPAKLGYNPGATAAERLVLFNGVAFTNSTRMVDRPRVGHQTGFTGLDRILKSPPLVDFKFALLAIVI